MATWKVIETLSGNIETVSGLAANCRPARHEQTVWEGEATDKAQALKANFLYEGEHLEKG